MRCWKCEDRIGEHPFRTTMFRRVSDCTFFDYKRRLVYVCVSCANILDHPDEWPEITDEVTYNLQFVSELEIILSIVREATNEEARDSIPAAG
jgi:hypothetical protein